MKMHMHRHHDLTVFRKNSFLYWVDLCWFWVSLTWLCIRAIFFWWLFAILVWDVTDLLGIPIIQDMKKDIQVVASFPGKIFVKENRPRFRIK